RRWRKQFWVSLKSGQLRDFYRTLRERDYSAVVDAQTSLKSALVTRLARGERRGPDKHSVREYGAHWAYQQQVAVAQDILAVDRWRQLFSATLGYPLPSSTPDFGLKGKTWPESEHRPIAPYLVAVTNA